MSSLDIIDITLQIVAVFEKLGISYHIGGSMVSSHFGTPRSTLDVDLVVDLKKEQISNFINNIPKEEYYLDESAVHDAVKHQSSFNILHRDTMVKIDVFILPKDSFHQQMIERKILKSISETNPQKVYFPTPEDIILQKLIWYQLGDKVSDKQWQDILGVLKIQGNQLDFNHLQKWASSIGVQPLLEKALKEAKVI